MYKRGIHALLVSLVGYKDAEQEITVENGKTSFCFHSAYIVKQGIE